MEVRKQELSHGALVSVDTSVYALTAGAQKFEVRDIHFRGLKLFHKHSDLLWTDLRFLKFNVVHKHDSNTLSCQFLPANVPQQSRHMVGCVHLVSTVAQNAVVDKLQKGIYTFRPYV